MKKIFILFLILYASPVLADGAFVAPPCQAFGTISGTCLQGAGALGSPSSVGTLPAFTLGGTISGGGNSINNIAISATSVTSPLYIGGSGTTQSSIYKTTTGIGASGADHIFQVGNNGSLQPARLYNSGAVSLGGSLDKAAIGQVSIQGSAVSGIYIKNTVDGTGNVGTIDIQNSTGGVELTIQASEPSRNNVLFGITLGNWASLIDIGTNGLVIGEFANAPIVFGTNNLERMRLLAGLSIGTTTDPGAGSLQVNTTIVAPNIVSDAGLTDTTLCWKNSATTGTFLKGSGTLGICLGTSGAQFKTAFAPMVGGLEEVMGLNLQNYRYKNGYGDNGERIQYGLTAQDVDKVMPDLVRRDTSGEAVNYDAGAFLFIGLRAIQELKADNDNLQACQATWKCRIFGIK